MGARLTRESLVVAGRNQASTRLTAGETESIAVLGLEDGIYYELTGVGMRIWQLIEEPTTVAGVVETLLTEFDVDRDRCEADLLDLLRKMVAKGLVEIREAPGG